MTQEKRIHLSIDHYLARDYGKNTHFDLMLQERLRDMEVGTTFAFVTPEKTLVFECIEIQKDTENKRVG